MKELDYKFYTGLRKTNISLNQVPKRVKNSEHFQTLLRSKIIDTEKSGRGSKIIITKIESYDNFLSKYFSDDDSTIITKSSNIRKLRDSKARKTKSPSVFFIRGFKNIQLNNKEIDLNNFTQTFGLFSIKEPVINTNKICFVENLDTFLKVEKLFGTDFIYLHKYGRIGIASLQNISADTIQIFVDYDFNGLDEYLRIKSVYPNAALFLPDNFDELFYNHSKVIKGKQKQSKKVSESKLEEVIRIRELVSKTNRFLEQEILIND